MTFSTVRDLFLAAVFASGIAGAAEVEPWPLPATGRAAQPDLVAAPGGALLLSWLEQDGDGHRLRLARGDGTTWAAPVEVARGGDWFVNWADTPHVWALADGSLWAHWLRSTGPGRMDYGIDMVRSGDGGASWSAPVAVDTERAPGDRGFVTLWAQDASTLGVAWLDSRQKAAARAGGEHAHAGHEHGGGAPMMLRAALFDGDVQRRGEWPLDASTCDCCTTASAATSRGQVVVYRGRSADEIRDIRLVRFADGAWTAPVAVHEDGWKIAGCPVNGPAVHAEGLRVWVAWYTEADGEPELRLARSDDAGDRFAAPVTVARGPQVLGRVALAGDADGVRLAWLESDGQGQRLRLARYDAALAHADSVDVARLAAAGRASGLPRLALRDGIAHLVWTDVVDGRPVLRGARVR
ncbi:sialidase family protein [Coralloluteibacterium stylophorae]|uniref:Exo-alpha-sialidase n=1 Tax=Coralloluteibacterium stylophorae TaxID=1776034 RepID=A0A8J8AWK5_9GAMM|nr:sialidase family protein [Coralloluteibacterium stylophorae]MBS7458103.1 exo-alpha-sialidase [Coralloluteibacterium stylophorae]